MQIDEIVNKLLVLDSTYNTATQVQQRSMLDNLLADVNSALANQEIFGEVRQFIQGLGGDIRSNHNISFGIVAANIAYYLH
jgi:hypothetical protein